jgi:hypothetical protein
MALIGSTASEVDDDVSAMGSPALLEEKIL